VHIVGFFQLFFMSFSSLLFARDQGLISSGIVRPSAQALKFEDVSHLPL